MGCETLSLGTITMQLQDSDCLASFPGSKRQKAGRGLGTRLVIAYVMHFFLENNVLTMALIVSGWSFYNIYATLQLELSNWRVTLPHVTRNYKWKGH